MTIQDVTIVGNICTDVELRYTPQGTPVAQFNVAVNDRSFNSETNKWEDGDATFYRVSAWKQIGEHASETLAKGMEVIVKGKFTARNYTTREGAERTALEVAVNPGKGGPGPVADVDGGQHVEGAAQRGAGAAVAVSTAV
ncbi:single-stranded DNA-binding protein [Corynebacterium striatum]